MRLISLSRSEDLRDAYREQIRQFTADELVFIDESIFSEKTGWRHCAYGPLGKEARYSIDIWCGKSWSILLAYTLHHGYLEGCLGVKEGYFNTEQLLNWLCTQLFPALARQFNGKAMCIVLDNCSTHCNERISETIRSAGHTLHYLLPYSPDYNPIELTFSVLKAWLRRNYYFRRDEEQNFGDFL